MVKRVFLIVLDSLGIGHAPDAAQFGDEGSDTLCAVSSVPGFRAENLAKLGLLKVGGESFQPDTPAASYARMTERSAGKDTTVGHWEIAGVVSESALPTYPDGFPKEVLEAFENATGRGILCNKPYSGTEVIRDFGEEHIKKGKWIVYTSADSVFQIASHEDVVPLDELYRACQVARSILKGKHGVGRVIARPFTGNPGEFVRTANRRDFSISPPSDTMLDYLKRNGFDVISVGKIYDIFAHKGITKSYFTHGNREGMEQTSKIAAQNFHGLCFVNLVDFDMLYGHRNDCPGYAKALMEFDQWLSGFLSQLKEDDILMITADHGCDPSTPSTDHSREQVPLLVYGKQFQRGIDLGVRKTFADVAKTILDLFSVQNNLTGTSFLKQIDRRKDCNSNIRPVDIIEKKKAGESLSVDEINSFFQGYLDGEVRDYQMSAFLMAVCLRGMSFEETLELTRFMARSGETLNLSDINGICADKHSTGGIGDKTTLIVAPIVASCDIKMAKMSGRGLGYTGGTIDKLSSIEGFQSDLPEADFKKIIRKVGAAIVSQTKNLAPADKKLYALRDVTGTTDSIPLIASSIMSKKIASGAQCILLDVKCGSGAFMKSYRDAEALAEMMVRIGTECGRKTWALITDMSQPLGYAVGNLLEVQEALDVLHGSARGRLRDLCIELSAYILAMALDITLNEARLRAAGAIDSGKAYAKFCDMVAAQGGNLISVEEKKAPYSHSVLAWRTGYISNIDALKIGMASSILGAGRVHKEDSIDLLAGVSLQVQSGDYIEKGDVLAELYSSSQSSFDEALGYAKGAFRIGKLQPERDEIVMGSVLERSSEEMKEE